MAEEIVECFGAPVERVRVVPLGIDDIPVTPDAAVGASEPASGSGGSGSGGSGSGAFLRGRPYVLSLGRTEPRKDLGLLVRAFDEVAPQNADVDLVIAGPEGSDEEPLAQAIAQARHGDRIRRLGWVSDTKKAELLRGAAVFVYPSVYEGFGIPPLEAMAAGVPVVATGAGGVPETVGPAAVVVPVGDQVALAAGLARLLGDIDERERLVTAGYQRVKLFSWGRCGAGFHDLYRDAVASRGR
jgi:alpha-1,3-rhamnosyl/mannosyltransferase